jgi:hypothetical protein
MEFQRSLAPFAYRLARVRYGVAGRLETALDAILDALW